MEERILDVMQEMVETQTKLTLAVEHVAETLSELLKFLAENS